MENETNLTALKNPWFYISLGLAVVMIFILFSSNQLDKLSNLDDKSQLPLQNLELNEEVSVDDDPVLGDSDAPVTIIEFSDYECPYCTRFYENTLPQLRSEYIDTGKVKLVYRDFPLSSIHNNAQKAAEAAEVARELGGNKKYWEMHNLLFERGVSGGVESFKQYARDIGLDGEDFDSILDSGKYADEVRKDIQDGESYGVQGTPTFFINGKILVGAQPFSAFQQIIEEELK